MPAGPRCVASKPADVRGQDVQVGVLAGLFFAVEEASVHDDLKNATGAGDQFNGADPFRSERPQFGRQTGGAGLVVSHLAIFDGDVVDHGRLEQGVSFRRDRCQDKRFVPSRRAGGLDQGRVWAARRKKTGVAGSHASRTVTVPPGLVMICAAGTSVHVRRSVDRSGTRRQ